MEEVRREKMQVRQKVGKSRNTMFFQCFVAPEEKSRLAKAAGAEPARQMKDEILNVLGRSTFGNKKCQNTWVSDDFWKLRCRKKCVPLWHEARFESNC